jgi:hypothetical protein
MGLRQAGEGIDRGGAGVAQMSQTVENPMWKKLIWSGFALPPTYLPKIGNKTVIADKYSPGRFFNQ